MANNEAPAEFTDFEIHQDLSEVDAWGGEQRPLVPAGEYQLTITHVEQKPSSNNNPMIVVTFEVASGPEKGSKLWGNYVLTQKAMGRIKALVVACGGSLDVIRASELMGATIEATIVHNEGQAKIGPDGNPGATPVYANVINERAPEQAAPAPTPAPPVTRATQAKPQNGAARRA